jgi:hypothetical protein
MLWGKKPGGNGVGKFSMAAEDDTSLGNILVSLGYITAEQLEEAVEFQKKFAPRIGEVLVQMKILTVERLEAALIHQKIARGQLTFREETRFYQAQSQQLVGEVAEEFRKAAAVTTELVSKLQIKSKV